MDNDSNKDIKEGEDMLALRKDNTIENGTNTTYAKTADVLKAIMKSNKKHSKMMKMLSK